MNDTIKERTISEMRDPRLSCVSHPLFERTTDLGKMHQRINGGEGLMRYSFPFVVITAIFVTCLLTANIVAVKLIDIAGFIMPAGIVIFPVSYIFGDVLTEVYGYSAARRVIWLGFACNLLMVITFTLAGWLPSAPFWKDQSAYDAILGYTPRLLIASFAAFLIGSFANAFVMAKMKVATNGRWLWTRTISSTLVGEGLDSMVFITIAFAGTIPFIGMVNAIFTQWLFKSLYEVVATPLTYGIVNRLKAIEGVDVFDRTTEFNPVSFDS